MTGDPKHADPAALRAELWEVYLYKFLPSRPTSNAERHRAALDRLAELQRAAVGAPENPSAGQEIVDDAMVLLQLLVAEVGAPFLERMIGARFLDLGSEATGVPGAGAADRIASLLTDNPMRARGLLLDLIQQQRDACRPPHRRALEPAVAIVPRDLLTACYDALAARDMGEMHSFLTAPPTRRVRPWSFDGARLHALEHVEFLFGQGRLKKKAAYGEVNKAMGGGVSDNTLRGWRTELRQSTIPDLDVRLKIARRAGELARRLERGPDIGSGEAIDDHVNLALGVLRDDEPLAIFGARYRREFGSLKSRG
jgi:hypothetical protein